MTFLRTSASCTPSNLGTPTRLGAAHAIVVNSTPASSAMQPIRTRGTVAVTRDELSIRKEPFARTATAWKVGLFLTLAGLSACAAGGPRVIFDQTGRFG